MKTLFERVFNGSDQMFAKAEEEVNKIVAEVGRDAPLTMPSTAYCLACIYAYIKKFRTSSIYKSLVEFICARINKRNDNCH